MVRLDNLFEKWAAAYQPIGHVIGGDNKQKAFYRANSLSMENEFVRNVNTAKSPCMVFSTVVDAEALPNNDKVISYKQTLYFMLKQTSAGMKTTHKTDDDAACECKADLDEICQDFLAFLADIRSLANSGNSTYILGLGSSSNMRQDITYVPEDNYITISDDIRSTLRGIDLSSVAWGSLPQFKNGWWGFGFQFIVKEPRRLCVNTEKYNIEY